MVSHFLRMKLLASKSFIISRSASRSAAARRYELQFTIKSSDSLILSVALFTCRTVVFHDITPLKRERSSTTAGRCTLGTSISFPCKVGAIIRHMRAYRFRTTRVLVNRKTSGKNSRKR